MSKNTTEMTKLYLRWSDIVELSGKLKSPRFVFGLRAPPPAPYVHLRHLKTLSGKKVGFVDQKQAFTDKFSEFRKLTSTKKKFFQPILAQNL